MIKNEKVKVNQWFSFNCMAYTPDSMQPSKKYPLIIFAHGTGEMGTDINKLYNNGLPAVLKGGFIPPYDCIIIAPQATSYGIRPDWAESILTDILNRYPIDETRIYLTGLSAGGWLVWGSQLNVPTAIGKRFAALVPLSAACQDLDKKPSDFDKFIETKVPSFAVTGDTVADKELSYKEQNEFVVSEINKRVPGLAQMQVKKGAGHGGWWNDIYKGTYKLGDKTFWEYLAQFPKTVEPEPPKPPVFTVGDIIKMKLVEVGADQYTFEIVP